MFQLFDSHCHLNFPPLVTDPAQAIIKAGKNHVTHLLVPGADLESSVEGTRLAERFPKTVVAAVGVHPHYLDKDQGNLEQIRTLASTHQGVVAIGEVGLDNWKKGQDLPQQVDAFKIQAQFAWDLGLPMVIHCRGPIGKTLEILSELGPGGPGGVFHSYGGSVEMAARLFPLGYRFGFGGVITREHARRVRAVAAAIPLDQIVIETDAPFIPTAKKARGMVEPSDLQEVAKALAQIKGVSVDEVAATTRMTAMELFRLSSGA